MFSYVFPAVCVAALRPVTPKGVSVEDAQKRLLGIVKSELGKAQFAESDKATKSGKAKRLKVSKQEIAYQTRMAADKTSVSVKALDTYNWLFDVHEMLEKWGQEMVNEVSIPVEIVDWIAGHLEGMKPSLSERIAVVAATPVGTEGRLEQVIALAQEAEAAAFPNK